MYIKRWSNAPPFAVYDNCVDNVLISVEIYSKLFGK